MPDDAQSPCGKPENGKSKADFAKLQKELDELRTEYQSFVYAVGHDLAAPFRQIEGFSNIILDEHGDQFDEKTKRHFSFVISGSEKGKAILNALLNYSRLVNAEFNSSVVDSNKVLNEVKEELSVLIEDSGAQFSCNALPGIVGDYKQIHMLFYQLIHNALHYSRPGESPIISLNAVEQGELWKFDIRDNGIGIREKMFDKIFIALRRGVAEKKYSGIGMGLTIAKAVSRRHGGEIWVESEEGVGSTISFTLGKETQV